MDYEPTTWSIIYYITYPVVYILGLILNLLYIITAPLQHLVHHLLYACWYPIRILAKFEVCGLVDGSTMRC